MNRIPEKVKDIVEVRTHVGLTNFASDPLRTLSGYHFTDVTADLMSKWLTRVLAVSSSHGVSLALAGFRGVGKSHFLAAFGTILSHPELRSRVSDPLVSSTAHSVARRSFPVAYVRRGLQKSLFLELKEALAPIIGCDPSSLSESLSDLLMRARQSTGDDPLILLIDTALERSARVSRDDGIVLSDIAEAAKTLGIFVGIALDDDISGADGPNAAISGSYSIDYLDQEHLYKIVDTHIFPKQNRMHSVLHEIYDHYRRAVPSFRWSEERFSSLYPLHPSIMEIAPFVRLYMQDFALLSFASEAGSRILGRPANSLIAPDEVFDKVEKALREVDALKGAFETYDRINTEVVAQIPVVKRLQAKLILKGLFLFSLNDEGASASEIGASMLIYDENDPVACVRQVETILTSFHTALPDQVRVQDSSTGPRFSLKLDGKDDFNQELSRLAALVPKAVATEIFKRTIDERFTDCSMAEVAGAPGRSVSQCAITWRGGLRRGQIVWDGGEVPFTPNAVDAVDWSTVIRFGREDQAPAAAADTAIVVWKPAELADGELDVLRRFHVLQTDAQFRAEFQDHLPAATQVHAFAAERIFQRSFLNDGTLIIEGFEYNFTDEARNAQSLAQIFTIMLESLFEGKFPLHPYFASVIKFKDVTALVTDFFGGARPKTEEVQALAGLYCQPIGIVSIADGVYIPADADELRASELVKLAFEAIDAARGEVTPLERIFGRLGAPPYGLVREGTYLLLSAMVAARLLEFVTSNGDRISYRSLDLKLIWDDIIGVSPPTESVYSNERLLFWGSLLTGSSFTSLKTTEDRLAIMEALTLWADEWKSKDIAARFDALRDDQLNTRNWRLASMSTRAFKSVADAVGAVGIGAINVETCLQLIAEAFSDSESEFARHARDLESLVQFIEGVRLRTEAVSWLSLCEVTGDQTIDQMRLELYRSFDNGLNDATPGSIVELNNKWLRFRKMYSEYFIDRHDMTVVSPYLREKLAEIMKTDIWWEFENLSDIVGFDGSFRRSTKQILGKIRRLDCPYDTSKLFAKQPFCGCPYTLRDAGDVEALPESLWRVVNQGLLSYRETLRANEGSIKKILEPHVKAERSGTTKQAFTDLLAYLATEKDFRRLSDPEIQLIRKAFSALNVGDAAPAADQPSTASDQYSLNSAELPDFADAVDELNALLESMPQ
ncbi:MAG: hypothetical protein K1X36_01210 [Pyrinomonadaceae bacterium]|nr:hypothetical protein [Pyrinomonadaceae bacterium]